MNVARKVEKLLFSFDPNCLEVAFENVTPVFIFKIKVVGKTVSKFLDKFFNPLTLFLTNGEMKMIRHNTIVNDGDEFSFEY